MGEDNMRIGVLSGKGGTGKTLVSVNLAYVLDKSTYIDCDVEEPNGWLFLKPKTIKEENVYTSLPSINDNKCIGCKECVDFCKFNALAYTNKLMVFNELCHGCDGCILLCKQEALKKEFRQIGRIIYGKSDGVNTRTGILNTGEVSGVPIINDLLHDLPPNEDIVIDCPPGSSCTVMESIKDLDYCVLVTEPTIFGIHNLEMVYRLVKLFKKPHGVIINKYIDNIELVEDFCKKNDISIIGKIPYEQEVASLNSKGNIVASKKENFKQLFLELLDTIKKGGE